MMDIEKKIDEKLRDYGFTREDLTVEEMEMLKEEILLEDKGYKFLDGVLALKPMYKVDKTAQ